MKKLTVIFFGVLSFMLVPVHAAELDKKDQKVERDQAEVVFVLDSTCSMSGLIEGAKQKIWNIANSIITQDSRPEVKIGLITYRDRGDDYITKFKDLTDDIDAVYAELTSFSAGGGGDGPESVNQALHEAVTKMSWSPREKHVYRVIFLVGDFPPHMDYDNDVKYLESCTAACDRHIIINTIQCGVERTCTPIWKEIANKGEGTFIQIAQHGGMIIRESPYDAEIAKLTDELDGTVILYGDITQQAEVTNKIKFARKSSFSLRADRAEFNINSKGNAIQGKGDLVVDADDNAELLGELKETELPENMQKMSMEERNQYVAKQQEKRREINTKISELIRKRTDWLAEDSKKRAKKAVKSDTGMEKSKLNAHSTAPVPGLSETGDTRVIESTKEKSSFSEESLSTDGFDASVSEVIQKQMNQLKGKK